MINYNSEEEKCFYNKVGKIIGWDFSKMKYKMVDDSKFQFPDEFFDSITARHMPFNIREVNRLLKQFEESKKMMKMFSNGSFKMPF